MLVATVEAKDRKYGEQEYEIWLLHEFGIPAEGLRTKRALYRKIQELYVESMQHDVLFSDYTKGNLESFVTLFLEPRGVWFEIKRVLDQKIIGAAYLTDVIVNYDADAHFTVWDSVGAGREPVFIALMNWVMERYNLKRLTAEIPAYQSGTIRMAKRLGFKEEGVKREAILHKNDEWVDSIIFGILWEELKDGRWRKKRNPVGNKRFNNVSSGKSGDIVHGSEREAVAVR